MNDNRKTKPQLINELNELRNAVAEMKRDAASAHDSSFKEPDYKSILSHLNAIVLAGNHEEFVYIGGNFEDILGYSLDDWATHKGGIAGFWHEHLDPRDRDKTSRMRKEAIEVGEDHILEYRMITKDDRLVWFHDTVNVEVKDNWQISVRAVMVDITEEKDLQNALNRAREGLEIRVDERTRELRSLNKKLTEEIAERKIIERELSKSKEYANNIIESSLNMIIATDKNRRIVEFNKAACETFGYSKEEVVGKKVGFLYASQNESRRIFKAVKACDMYRGEIENIRKNGERFTSFLTATIMYDTDGNMIGTVGNSQDITEQKRAEQHIKATLAEKEVLIREIHHRVKNNMQVISSMLKLQLDRIKNKEHFHVFHESINRVHSMALIHTMLYQSNDLSRISFREYIPTLCNNLMFLYKAPQRGINIDYKIQDIFITVETAIPCGLIINELVSNALKHAFPGKKNGTITVVMKWLKGEKIRLRVSDDGVGMPKNFDFKKLDSLGLEITRLLTYQIGGKIKHFDKNGTGFALTFKGKS